MNKKSIALLALLGVAILAVAYFGLYYPPPSDEAAQGAIGAVKKHRSDQIGDADVLLGSEEARQAEQILYIDHLTDATALENFRNSLGSFIELGNRQGTLGSQELEGFRSELGIFVDSLASRIAELEQRTAGSFEVFLESFDVALESEVFQDWDQLENMRSALSNVEAQFENKLRLGASDLALLESSLGTLWDRFGNLADLEAASLQNVARSLENIESILENRDMDLSSQEIDFGALESEIEALENRAFGVRVLAAAPAYFSEIALEQRMLENFHQRLSAFFTDIGNREQLEMSFLASRLGELGSFEESLEARIHALGNIAFLNMRGRMEHRLLEQRHLENIEGLMEATTRALENRAGTLGSELFDSFESGLESCRISFNNRMNALEMRFLGSMELELNAMDMMLQSADFFNEESLQSARLHFDNLTRQLEARISLGNEDLQVLESRARQLENRFGEIGSRIAMQ